jgi:hypothetical protein
MQTVRFGLVFSAFLLMAGCQDLVVDNTNAPDRLRALSEPAGVETLISGSFPTLWGRLHSSASTAQVFPLVGDEFTATYANSGALELSSEPRVAFNNTQTADVAGLGRFQWYDWNEALSNANEALAAIDAGVRLRTGEPVQDNTLRGQAFAKFIQGISLGYLGLFFDQSSIADETTDLSDPTATAYRPYDEVVAASIESLREAAAFAESGSFEIPADWTGGRSLSNVEFGRLMHSFIARFLVLSARTPEERAAVDWAAVIEATQRGVQQDFVVDLVDGVRESTYLLRAQSSGSFSMRADIRLVGPADVSGTYQQWRNMPLNERNEFLITTPDRRITGDSPTDDGKYFRYRPAQGQFRPDRGLYHFSSYQWYRYNGQYQEGTATLVSVDEMNLYRAEALLRTNRAAEAAELINRTRVANGELPAVTANGVPQSADCAPRTIAGACGSLLDALHYERMIELAGIDAARAFFDRRGFGTLTEGTFVHLPVPARELETIGLPTYTFGGVGGTMSADADESVQ